MNKKGNKPSISALLEEDLGSLNIFELSQEGVLIPIDHKSLVSGKKDEGFNLLDREQGIKEGIEKASSEEAYHIGSKWGEEDDFSAAAAEDIYLTNKLIRSKEELEDKFILFFKDHSLYNITFIKTKDAFLNEKEIEETHQKLLFLIEKGYTLSEQTFSYLSLYYCLTHRYYECIRLIEVHIKDFKSLDIFYNMLGNCFYLIERKKKAFSCFKKASEFNKSFSAAYFSMAYIYFDNKDYERALSALLGAQQDFYKNLDFLLLMAECYEHIGALKKALLYYEKYLKSEKEIAIMQKVAEIFYSMKDFGKALSYFNKFKSVETQGLLYIKNLPYKLAVCNFFIDKRQEALEHITFVLKQQEPIFLEEGEENIDKSLFKLFKKAFDLRVYDMHTFEIFSMLTRSMNISFASFLKDFVNVEEIEDIDILLSIARLSLKRSNFKTAIHFLKKILSKDPEHIEALVEVSKSYYIQSEDKNKAYNIFFFLDDKNKTDGEIDSYLGLYYFDKKDYIRSIHSFSKAIEKEYINFTVLSYIGKSYYNKQDTNQALHYMQKAYDFNDGKIDKENVELLILLGKLYIDKAEYKEGIKLLKEALSLDSKLKEVHECLSSTYKHILEEKSVEHYSKYIDL